MYFFTFFFFFFFFFSLVRRLNCRKVVIDPCVKLKQQQFLLTICFTNILGRNNKNTKMPQGEKWQNHNTQMECRDYHVRATIAL
jgi:hypothetical protein